MREDHYDLIGKISTLDTDQTKYDSVENPSHYAKGKYQVWDIIDYFKLNYRIGNVVKYLLRAGVKTPNPLQDYKKARAYLDREIGILEGTIRPFDD